jgi:hypothetical protein
MKVQGNDSIGVTAGGRRRPSWPVAALLALGAWLVVSPLVLGTAQVTAGAVSAVTSGLAWSCWPAGRGWPATGSHPC